MIPISSVGASLGSAQQTSAGGGLGPAPTGFALLEVSVEGESQPLPVYALASLSTNKMIGYAEAGDGSAFDGEGAFFAYDATTGVLADITPISSVRRFSNSACAVATDTALAAYFKGRVGTPFDIDSGISIVRYGLGGGVTWQANITATGSSGSRPFDGDVASYDGDAFFAYHVPNGDRVIYGRLTSGGSLAFIRQIIMPAPGVRLAVSDAGILLVAGGDNIARVVSVSLDGNTILWQKQYVGNITSGSAAGTVAIFDNLGYIILGGDTDTVVRLMIDVTNGDVFLSDRLILDTLGTHSYTHGAKQQVFPATTWMETAFQLYNLENDEQLVYLVRISSAPTAVELPLRIREALGYAYMELYTTAFDRLVNGAHMAIVGTNANSYIIRVPTDLEDASAYVRLVVGSENGFTTSVVPLTPTNTAFTLSTTTHTVSVGSHTPGSMIPRLTILEPG